MAQSYLNRQGSGSRLDGVIVFKTEGLGWLNNPLDLLDGIVAAGNTWWSSAAAGAYFQYDFGEPRLITASRWRQQSASTHGDWIWRGSQDGVTWTDIGSAFVLGGSEVSEQSLAANTTPYRFYRMAFLSGSVSGSPYLYQIEFLIDDGLANAQSFGSPFSAGERRYLVAASSTVPIGSSTGVSVLLDGKLNSDSGSLWFNDASSGAVTFDFGTSVVLDFGRFFQSGNHLQGVWQWQGSVDGSAWENVGGTFTLHPDGQFGVFWQDLTSLQGNTKSFRLWRMAIVGGTTNSVPTLYQIVFRASKATADPLWDDVILRQTFDVDFSDVSKFNRSVVPFNTSSGAVPTIGLPAKFGQSLNCDFFGQGLKTAGVDFRFGAGDFTVETWVYRPASGGSFPTLVLGLYQAATAQRSWRIVAGNGSNPALDVALSTDGNTAVVNTTTPFTLENDRWVHLCFERSSGVFRLYKNGVMAWKNAAISAALFNATGDFRIGGPTDATDNNNGFLRFDDLRVTKGVARYKSDAGFAPPQQPLPTSGGEVPSNDVKPDPGRLAFQGYAPTFPSVQSVAPLAGRLAFGGYAPDLTEDFVSSPAAGRLELRGAVPVLTAVAPVLDVPAGGLSLRGAVPQLLVGLVTNPPPGGLTITGHEPLLFTKTVALASQAAVLTYNIPAPPIVRASQGAAIALGKPPPPPVRASQSAAIALGMIVPVVAASQAAVIIFGVADACVTQRCQIWKITRRDGRLFLFTSHDRPVRYGGESYKPCRSLDPSASENASTLGSVGNIELTGIIDDESISEADLYGGLFDDAYVTVDLVAWGATPEAPRRLAAGWTGTLSHGDTGFNMEVLGAAARLDQQALVQMVTPGCRWTFGDARCGVDAEALAVSGQVTVPAARGRFLGLLDGVAGTSQWENGVVAWSSGANEGQVCEVKTVDWTTGEVVLWASPSYMPATGDTFELRPGCDKVKGGGCTVYANVINHGGFADVPGADSLLETPDAKI